MWWELFKALVIWLIEKLLIWWWQVTTQHAGRNDLSRRDSGHVDFNAGFGLVSIKMGWDQDLDTRTPRNEGNELKLFVEKH